MSEFADTLIDWYEKNKRDLPWRDTQDPYRIWISEIILQQTRVAQGYDYYIRFVRRFPDVFSLAEAEEDEVVALDDHNRELLEQLKQQMERDTK